MSPSIHVSNPGAAFSIRRFSLVWRTSMCKHFRHTKPLHPYLRLISALLLCIGLTGLAAAQSPSEPFHFGKVDLEYLDQIRELDRKFEERGLVYRDPELNAY